MDKEFHFTGTYLLCRGMGLPFVDANLIAQCAQFVDDNTEDRTIRGVDSCVTQTMNILRPRKQLLDIYPWFHFVPGNPSDASCARVDGLMSHWNTTPDSINARKMVKVALLSGNNYRLGIALHAYADTFAHQNFTGRLEHFNGMDGIVEQLTPNIGHADARHDPDRIGLEWRDERLMKPDVYNNNRFKDCFGGMASLVGMHKNSKPIDDVMRIEGSLEAWLDLKTRSARRKKAEDLALQKIFGGDPLPKYVADTWADRKIAMHCWIEFQEAARAHRAAMKEMIGYVG